MKINYLGQFKADIVLDKDIIYHGMNDNYYFLQDYIDKANYLMDRYGFEVAQIIDSDNKNILVEIEKDCNDHYIDNELFYYDNDNICNY